MTTTALSPPPSRDFPYRIEREAGAGAMGVVYRAIDINLARPVAVKFLKADADSGSTGGEAEAPKRFLQEARAAAALTHPGVTTIHRVDKVDGQLYIVMEWLEGKTLDKLIEEEAPIPPLRAADLLFDLLDILESTHEAGIVHRDIKPSNLVVVESGQLKVTDFGIARLQEHSLVETMIGSVLATPRYASPEQLQGEDVDGRADLFAAAVVFYQLMTGHLPWDGENLAQIINSMFGKPPVPLRERDPRLPASLEPWIVRALAKDPDDRFTTARQMAEELRQLLGLSEAWSLSSGSAYGGSVAVPPNGTAIGGLPPAATATATLNLTPPVDLFKAPQARNPWQAIRSLIESWQVHSSGIQQRDVFLKRLIEVPLHAEAFAGAARYDSQFLLVENGVVLAVVDIESGQLQPEGELPSQGAVHLYKAPDGHGPAFMTLLASVLQSNEPIHRDLDSDVVNLGAFAAKLQSQGFRGVMHLDGEQLAKNAHGFVLLDGERSEQLVIGGSWPRLPDDADLATWLRTPSIRAHFTASRVEPPVSWYPLAFPALQATVTPLQAAKVHEGTGSSTLTKIYEATTGLTAELPALFQIGFDSEQQTRIGEGDAEHGSMARFLRWMVDELPQFLVERKQADGWKYLGDWLLQIRKACLHAWLDRPGGSQRDYFDLVTRDDEDKVLHVARRLSSIDADTLLQEVEIIKQAKQARTDRGDIGGAFLVAPTFTPDVVEAYTSQLHQGLGNLLLQLDKSMGYEGFVRMGTRRGFHLMLVEENESGFHPLLL